MAKVKHLREKKRQLGQFMTPSPLSRALVERQSFGKADKVLEPGFGEGSFLIPLIEEFMKLRDGDFRAVLTENIWGIELDPDLYKSTLAEIKTRWGELPQGHNLAQGDFLLEEYREVTIQNGFESPSLFDGGGFDVIIGNPPFGGTVDIANQDKLEREFGKRHGIKIKKETYSFFIVKACELLRSGGTVQFICSDTFLTIATMKGLRNFLMEVGRCEVVELSKFSEETSYPMVVLKVLKGEAPDHVVVADVKVEMEEIRRTANLSWRAGGAFGKYFRGPVVGDYLVASSGMTTGKNEYFVRAIEDGSIVEKYEMRYVQKPITMAEELEKARLGKLPPGRKKEIMGLEAEGATKRSLEVLELTTPRKIRLPHADYRFYNKAQPGIFFSAPRSAIYWKDMGDAVITYKKTGKWYLRGVGGAPFFYREGITWRLVSSRFDMRYLPEGYVLDSGAPCAFLRQNIDPEELWFILGWSLTSMANGILKGVLNHTMNIQGKDFERLPYPWWVTEAVKRDIILQVRGAVDRAMAGEEFTRESPELSILNELFLFP